MTPSSRRGFTLIELLVVIAIIAILAVVVVLTLNPAEMLAEARDSNRISDLTTMKQAIELYLADTSDPQMDQDGNYWDYYITLATDTIAQPTVDVDWDTGLCTSWPGTWITPDTSTEETCNNDQTWSGDDTLCTVYDSYSAWEAGNSLTVSSVIPASTTAQAQAIDGTGWVPIDFAAMDTGSPISSEPLDPVNQPGTSACTGSSPSLSSCGLFYSYIWGNGDAGLVTNGAANFDSDSFYYSPGTQFQLSAFMESTKYSHGGSADVETNSMISPFSSSTCMDPYEYFTGSGAFSG